MISVLICGYNPDYERDVKASISKTIGTEHEIIYFQNVESKGLCEVYNLLAAQSKGEILCFVHEDLEFITNNWGPLLIDAHQQYDVVGIAGGKYKTRTPSVWSTTGHYCVNLVQRFRRQPQRAEETLFHEHHPSLDIEAAVCVDGVFISVKRLVLDQIQFDDHNFKGFHGYDYDFSINASQYFKIGISKKIQLIHFSEGENGPAWIDAQIVLHHKWKHYLPIYTKDLHYENPTALEFLAYKQCIYKMKKFNYYRWDVLIKLFKIQYIYYGINYLLRKKKA